MLEPLDGENDAEGGDGRDGRPESEIAEPNAGVVDDLRSGLNDEIGNDGSEKGLKRNHHTLTSINIPFACARRLGRERAASDLYLLRPEVPVLRYQRGRPVLQHPHNRDASDKEAKGGNGGHPHVDEARRKVVSVWAQRAPSLLVPAERLRELAGGGEVAAPELSQRAVAREGARLEDDWSHVVEGSHGWIGCTCATVSALVGAYLSRAGRGGKVRRGGCQ